MLFVPCEHIFTSDGIVTMWKNTHPSEITVIYEHNISYFQDVVM